MKNPLHYLQCCVAGGLAFMLTGMRITEGAEIDSHVESNNRLAFELYAQLRAKNADENLFFSPFSISTAFAMVYAGAEGATARQMEGTLHFSNPMEVHAAFADLLSALNNRQKANAYKLHIANSLWSQQGDDFRDPFLRVLRNKYLSELQEVNFREQPEQARGAINQWVADKTNDKIQNIVPQGALDQMTRLVLVNAIYFKSSWMSVFDEAVTDQQPFFLLSGKQVQTPMMQQTHSFAYAETEQAQVLELPYERGELGMVIVLPRKKQGLPGIEEKLQLSDVQSWIGSLRPRRVRVALPKFKLESAFRLDGILQDLGMTHPFQPEEADFSGMNGKQDLFIQAALHKAFVDVDEQGTEAAAATAVTMGVTSVMPGDPVVFRADHPFIFLIRDRKTGSILFIGRLLQPGA